MAYQPIENYGIIGDMHSVALVGMDGSIDWLCFPHFDSPSVFAAILDDKKGWTLQDLPSPELRHLQADVLPCKGDTHPESRVGVKGTGASTTLIFHLCVCPAKR